MIIISQSQIKYKSVSKVAAVFDSFCNVKLNSSCVVYCNGTVAVNISENILALFRHIFLDFFVSCQNLAYITCNCIFINSLCICNSLSHSVLIVALRHCCKSCFCPSNVNSECFSFVRIYLRNNSVVSICKLFCHSVDFALTYAGLFSELLSLCKSSCESNHILTVVEVCSLNCFCLFDYSVKLCPFCNCCKCVLSSIQSVNHFVNSINCYFLLFNESFCLSNLVLECCPVFILHIIAFNYILHFVDSCLESCLVICCCIANKCTLSLEKVAVSCEDFIVCSCVALVNNCLCSCHCLCKSRKAVFCVIISVESIALLIESCKGIHSS